VALPRPVKVVLVYNPRVYNDSVAVSVSSAKIRYLGSVGARIDMAGDAGSQLRPFPRTPSLSYLLYVGSTLVVRTFKILPSSN